MFVCGRGGAQEGTVVSTVGLRDTARFELFPVGAGEPLKILKTGQGMIRRYPPLSLPPSPSAVRSFSV